MQENCFWPTLWHTQSTSYFIGFWSKIAHSISYKMALAISLYKYLLECYIQNLLFLPERRTKEPLLLLSLLVIHF